MINLGDQADTNLGGSCRTLGDRSRFSDLKVQICNYACQMYTCDVREPTPCYQFFDKNRIDDIKGRLREIVYAIHDICDIIPSGSAPEALQQLAAAGLDCTEFVHDIEDQMMCLYHDLDLLQRGGMAPNVNNIKYVLEGKRPATAPPRFAWRRKRR
jgi:hypothetical protein